MLPILLKETNLRTTAQLAIDRAQAWFGISRATAEQGITRLLVIPVALGGILTCVAIAVGAGAGGGLLRVLLPLP